jgi:hypothetical protein
MTRTYIKNGVIRSFKIEYNKVIATLQIAGRWVSNPLLTDIIADGWTEYTPPAPEPYLPTYSELVEQYIREHGYETYGAELAIINNYSQDPTTYAAAYAAYMQTRVDAKQYAQTHPYRELE